jgi:LysM repeat protein
MLKFFKNSLFGLFGSLGKITFKTILVPNYKLFLFIKNKVNKYLVHNPYLPRLIKNHPYHKPAAHILMAVVFIFVVANNFLTKNTYAEDFGKNSIFASLVTQEIDVEIVEKALDPGIIKEKPKTESIISQLNAIESKSCTYNINNSGQSPLALSQGGEALIKPTAAPFEKPLTNNQTTVATKSIISYTIESGDTLSSIAQKFGISINTILWENNLSLNSYLRLGAKLTILPVTGISYTVKSGDTLNSIAKKFGSTTDKILVYNNLESATGLKIKQKIIIPDGRISTPNTPIRSVNLTKSGASPSGKNFIWPSISKRITQYYHWGHSAIDIGAKLGTPIYASQGGRIEYAGWSSGYGYNILINHGNGTKTRYGHASKLYVKTGDVIEAGEVVGAVGSTGNSTGPHIHFEITINGAKVNPLSYL